MRTEAKICKTCGKEFIPTGRRQKYCKECGIIMREAYLKRWYEKHFDYNKQYYSEHKEKFAYSSEYYLEHKIRILTKQKRYNQFHLEQHNEAQKKYYLAHPEEALQSVKQWANNNPEKIKEIRKNWIRNNPEKVKAMKVRTRSKRRTLDYIPLNSSHEGYDFHHIDKTYGLYIPTEVHKSISHNVFTGKGMDIINALAWNYLEIP
jgi:hypothetical protein